MVKVICRAIDCIFWEDGHCSAEKITYDPEEGCLAYELIDDILDEDDWSEDDELGDLVDDGPDVDYPYNDSLNDDFDTFDDDDDDDTW